MEVYAVYSNKPILFKKEKRQDNDLINNILQASGLIVWSLLIITLVVVQNAMPRSENFFDKLFSVQLRTSLDYQTLTTSLWLFILLFTVSCTMIFLNTKRMKRDNDHIRPSPIITAVISLIASVCLYLIIQ